MTYKQYYRLPFCTWRNYVKALPKKVHSVLYAHVHRSNTLVTIVSTDTMRPEYFFVHSIGHFPWCCKTLHVFPSLHRAGANMSNRRKKAAHRFLHTLKNNLLIICRTHKTMCQNNTARNLRWNAIALWKIVLSERANQVTSGDQRLCYTQCD